MEFHQLRSFVAVAKHGKLATAADRLHTSQPSVSAHIKALEQELGLPLFTRTSRGMLLTEEGEKLLEKARYTLDCAQDLLLSAHMLRNDCSGDYLLGVNTDSRFLRINALFEYLAENHPGITVQVTKSTSMEIPNLVRDKHLDGGFVYGEQDSRGLIVTKVDEVRLYVTGHVSQTGALARADWAEVAAMPWIWVTKACPYHAAGKAAFHEHGAMPRAVIQTDDEEFLLSLVRAGRGLALLREDEAMAAVRAGEATVWDKIVATISVYFIQARNSCKGKMATAMSEAVEYVWSTESVTSEQLEPAL